MHENFRLYLDCHYSQKNTHKPFLV